MNARLSSLARRGACALNAALGIALAGVATVALFAPRAAADFPAYPPASVSASAPSATAGQNVPASVDLFNAMRILVMNANGLPVDWTAPTQTTPWQSSAWTVNQAACGATASLAVAANGGRKALRMAQVSGVTIFVGPPGVTATTGIPIPSGAAPADPMPGYTGEIDCVTASGAGYALGVSQGS